MLLVLAWIEGLSTGLQLIGQAIGTSLPSTSSVDTS